MRRMILGSLAVMAAGAGGAWGQGRPSVPPQPVSPSSLYGVQPAQYAGEPTPMAGNPMAGGPMAGGPMMGGDPSGGMMPGGPPMYPVPGYQGQSPYPEGGGGGHALVPQWWVNAEYLLWFSKSQPANQPYVTTSAPGDFGVIGAPTTQILLAPSGEQNYGLYSGFRIMGGWYKDCDRRCGYEFGGMLSEEKTKIYSAVSDQNGIPVLARPFNLASGGPGVYIVSNLGLASGGLTVATTSRFWGAEASFVNNIYRSCPDDACFWNTDVLAGIRFFQLREDLTFDTASTVIGGGATFVGQPVVAGGTILVRDKFESWNQFYGGQLGLRSTVNFGRCMIGLSGKIAFGMMHESVEVAGSTTLSDAGLGLNATANGGVYATSQNIGTYRNDEFAVMPEVGINFGYAWCSWLYSYIGYNALYIDNVARPGNAVPLAVNPALMPSSNNFGIGGVTPVVNTSVTQSEFWVQGVTFGFNVRY